MPMYTYKCNNDECNHEFEKVVRMTDRAETDCPKCKIGVGIRQVDKSHHVLQIS